MDPPILYSFTTCTSCDMTTQVIDYPDFDCDSDWFIWVPIRIPIELFRFRLEFGLSERRIITCFRNSRDMIISLKYMYVAIDECYLLHWTHTKWYSSGKCD